MFEVENGSWRITPVRMFFIFFCRKVCRLKKYAYLCTAISKNGVVVQLVRIPACHAGGRGFESRPYRKSLGEIQGFNFRKKETRFDSLAQQVEHNTFNVGVLGSSPKRITNNQCKMKRIPDNQRLSGIFVLFLSTFHREFEQMSPAKSVE